MPRTSARSARQPGPDQLTMPGLQVLPVPDAPGAELAVRKEPTVNQRAQAITKVYAEAEPFCKFPAVLSIVKRAIQAERWPDEEIRAAVLRLAEEERPVTVDALRFALQHPRVGNTGRRFGATANAQAGLELLGQLRAMEASGQ
jgi:hypothetical protein